MSENIFSCPFCGAEINENATFCKTCGSDSNTGWSETSYMDGIELGGDYEDNLRNELPQNIQSGQKVFLTTLIIVLIIIVITYLIFN